MTALSSLGAPAEILQQQRAFFATGATKSLTFRAEQLKRLKAAVLQRQTEIVAATKADLGRPEYEGYFELGVLNELTYILKRFRRWAQPRRVGLPLTQWPGSAWVQPEPLGTVLIIGPWNYPFQLLISPLMGAMAAGNCAILKPSELAPATSRVIAQLVNDTFEPHYIAAVEGGVETAQALLAQKVDHIFFTGGTRVGKIVMEAAAKQLTPVTLELGGKSPCIVDQDVDIGVTAKRIIWGKYVNAGQTCIAPDYLLVHEAIKPALMTALQQTLRTFFGEDPAASPDLARIVNDRQFDRLTRLLAGDAIAIGGDTDRDTRYIAPTILDNVSWDAAIMQDEIFGPILPVLTFQDIETAISQINARPKPLALYLFTRNQALQDHVLANTSSGGACLNDVFLQVAIWGLPFGGVGDSGIGAYHGKASFETFSHQKSVLKKPFWFDLAWRYAPYAGKLNVFKKIINAS
ncbi:Aldehyde dehydrogenase [Halomicronema hongdechloris C2206]|uniref:Aldehyde dehydrogenase n=1 Tax=Halomicronema hongdechloris C2206 TaxID=1641165 RepID=A0A1Z3HQV3_9CYAN|nr:aldehyde dehydrogenase [Halomicronema hongdechloris]ASC72507.1 Aldehyde dehydrogenase [Halomicronema hongdechloris C2206]